MTANNVRACFAEISTKGPTMLSAHQGNDRSVDVTLFLLMYSLSFLIAKWMVWRRGNSVGQSIKLSYAEPGQ